MSFAPVLDIEESNHREDESSDKVVQKILHRIQKSDIQIAVDSQVLSVDHGGCNVVDRIGVIAACGIQSDGVDGMYDGIFLHIQPEKQIHQTFKEFPDHAHGHGKTECNQRQEKRRQMDRGSLVIVENHHQRKADGGGEKAIQCVEHRVPERKEHIEFTDFSENLCGKDKQQDHDFQGGGQFDFKVYLDETRNDKQKQDQNTEKNIFVILVEKLPDHYENYKCAQNNIYGKGTFVLVKFHFYGFPHTLESGQFMICFTLSLFQ